MRESTTGVSRRSCGMHPTVSGPGAGKRALRTRPKSGAETGGTQGIQRFRHDRLRKDRDSWFSRLTWGIHIDTTMWHRRSTNGDRRRGPVSSWKMWFRSPYSDDPDQAESGGQGLGSGPIAWLAGQLVRSADLGGPPEPEPAVTVGGAR